MGPHLSFVVYLILSIAQIMLCRLVGLAVNKIFSVRFEVFTAAPMKNAFLWNVYSLQPPVHAGSSLAKFSTLKMEAKRRFTQDLHGATS
jgi:hypothetical protein